MPEKPSYSHYCPVCCKPASDDLCDRCLNKDVSICDNCKKRDASYMCGCGKFVCNDQTDMKCLGDICSQCEKVFCGKCIVDDFNWLDGFENCFLCRNCMNRESNYTMCYDCMKEHLPESCEPERLENIERKKRKILNEKHRRQQ